MPRRNSGRISGAKSSVSTSVASGVFDTFDVYNYRRRSNWPLVPKVTSASNTSGTIFENTLYTVSVSGEGFTANGLIYDGVSLNTFTVYSFRRIVYNASDLSICDLFMLIGHSNWGSIFGTRVFFGDTSTDSGGCYLYAPSSTNVLAVAMLLSKSGGIEVTAAECQTVVTNFTSRIRTYFGY